MQCVNADFHAQHVAIMVVQDQGENVELPKIDA